MRAAPTLFRPIRSGHLALTALLGVLPVAACVPAEIEDPAGGSTATETVSAESPESAAGNERRGIGAAASTDEGPISIARQELTIDGLTIDPRKSLIITDKDILESFPLKRVMDQFVAQSGVRGLRALALYRQWWDTANQTGTAGPLHCSTTFNGFPYACRRSEGDAAMEDPFDGPEEVQYAPVALVNRFDLAAKNGSDCGEYRIVYAKRIGIDTGAIRNLLNFEGVLANPNPSTGLAGCRPIQLMWAEQSRPGRTTAERVADLVKLYFTGMTPFLPVVHIDNYGASSNRLTGQIRTNQFIDRPWTLREFKLHKITGTSPSLRFEIATTKNAPGAKLFNPKTTGTLKADFDSFFPTMVKTLISNDVNTFSMAIPDRFNTGDDQQNDANDYRLAFQGASTLRTRIQTELTRLKSTLTPDNVVARATALSCAGCHQMARGANLGGGMIFPGSFNFVHTSEQPDNRSEIVRFAISDTLNDTFLPKRQTVMETFLTSTDPAPRCSGTSGQWSGCRGTGCWVCAEKTAQFPYYFANHPLCEKNPTCANQFGTCNASCPQPTDSDKSPAAGTCGGTSGQWKGCTGNGCAACSKTLVLDFPRYFDNHPRCARKDTCASTLVLCNNNCPTPTDADR
jgi:hypothetical protein